MGSEKFPKENEFDEFISTNGGSDNALTECEYTVSTNRFPSFPSSHGNPPTDVLL
jgi:hypothetical protein